MNKNEVHKMYQDMKMSKYNIFVEDQNGNLLIYNFLTGFSSLIMVKKPFVEKFKKRLVFPTLVHDSELGDYDTVVTALLERGILIDVNQDEDAFYNAKAYENTYDNDLYMTVLTTGKCNFHCSYCLEEEQNFNKGRLSEEAQNAIVKFVRKNISNHKGLHLTWFGGEPMLEMDTIINLSHKLEKICRARYVPYAAQITTNGYMLSAENFQKLYESKVYNYMVTVDGFKEQHDKYRCMHNGSGTYDVIMKNLLNIRDNPQFRFAHIIIRINVTREVLNVMDELIEFLNDTFSVDSRFKIMFIPVVNYSSKPVACDEYVSTPELSEKLNSNQVYLSKFKPEELNMYFLNPGKGCMSSMKNSFVFSPNLTVYKCVAHYDMPENCLGYLNMDGDLVVDDNLHKRWYVLKEEEKIKQDDCKECFYLPACTDMSRGCPYRQFHSINSSDSCHLKEEGFIKELEKEVILATQKYPYHIIEC